MSLIEHWLLWDYVERSPTATLVWDASVADRARELGRRIEGPFVPADQLAGAVVIDDAAITRAADAIGALGTDRIGAEPYAAARAILDAARGQ